MGLDENLLTRQLVEHVYRPDEHKAAFFGNFGPAKLDLVADVEAGPRTDRHRVEDVGDLVERQLGD